MGVSARRLTAQILSSDADGRLLRINTTTGVGTLFGAPEPGVRLSGLAFSPTGVLFASDVNGRLLRINTTTGEGTFFSIPKPAGASLSGLAFVKAPWGYYLGRPLLDEEGRPLTIAE
jgi:hypothetical protein